MSTELLIFKVLGYVMIGGIVALIRRRKQAHWLRRIVSIFFMWMVFTFAFVFAVDGAPIAIAVCAGIIVLAFGGPMATYIATPAGLPKVASTLATVGAVPYHVDQRGIGSIAAARTCLAIRHKRQPSDELAQLDERLAKATVLRPGTVAAKAFSCLALGDREQARILFKSVGDFALPLRTGPAQNFAARWLVADAASQGNWIALMALPQRLDTPLTRFAAACAARIEDGPDTIKSYKLRWKWLTTTSRLATRPLLKLALDATPPSEPPTGPLLARHVAALKNANIQTLIALADDWEDRVYDLDAPVRESVFWSLNAIADAHPYMRGRHHLFAGDADPMRELELALAALERRIQDDRILPPLDEWVELARIRDLYDQLTATDRSYRSLAYDAARNLITNYGADMFNKRKQKPIANALFVWMEREARAAEDTDMIELNTKNAACGYG